MKFIVSIIFIVIGVLTLKATTITKYLDCDANKSCQLYSVSPFSGNNKTILGNFNITKDSSYASCKRSGKHYILYLTSNPPRISGKELSETSRIQCNMNASALNQKLKQPYQPIKNFKLTNIFENLLAIVVGIITLLIGIILPFSKSIEELSPEERLKCENTMNRINETKEQITQNETVQTISRTVNEIDKYSNHPLVKFLRMFIR